MADLAGASRAKASRLRPFILSCTALFALPAPGATVTVRSTADGVALAANCPGAGCRLRDAVAKASSGDTIDFDTTVFGSAQTITLTSADIAIDKNLTIDASAVARPTIDANWMPLTATFNLAANDPQLTLRNLRLVDAESAIFFQYGTVVVDGCLFESHIGSYGAICVGGATTTLTVMNSTFSGNTGLWAGAVTSYTTSSFTNTAFVGNTGRSGSGTIGAGAILVYNGNVSVSGCTFQSNSGSGGAIYVYYPTSVATVTNSTFYANSGAASGAIFAQLGTATVNNATFVGTTAASLYNLFGMLTVRNSILAGLAGNCIGTVGNGGHNIDDGTSCGFGSTNGSMSNTDPLLSPLGNFGGPTQTVALLPNSPALDAGSACASPDQRAINRPQGTACDIGAFESRGFSLSLASGNGQSAPVNMAFASPLVVTVSSVVPGEPVDGGRVVFTPPASGASAGLAASLATISGAAASVTATANGTAGGPYSVAANSRGGTGVSFLLTNTLVSTTTTTASSAVATHSASSQSVTLSATVTSGAGTVSSGTVTFSVYNGATLVGSPAGRAVSGGSASVTWTLPAGTPAWTYSIDAAYGGGGSFGASSDNTKTLTVGKASATITAENKTKTYGSSDPTWTYLVSGMGGSETIDTPPTCMVSGVHINVGITTIGCSGATDADYTFSYLPGTLTVGPRAITVAAGTDSKAYDGTRTSTVIPTITVGSLASGDSASWSQTFDTKDVGTAKTLTPTGTVNDGNGGNNYSVTLATVGTGVIIPRGLTVTTNEATKVYGAPLPTFAVSYGGFVPGEGTGVLGGTLSFTTWATQTSPVADYDVMPQGLTSTSYAIGFVKGILHITPASTTTTLTGPAAPIVVGGSVHLVAAVAVVSPIPLPPQGTVTFNDGASVLCSAVALDASGQAVCDAVAPMPAGVHTLTAVHVASGSNSTGSSGSFDLTVSGDAPAITSEASATFRVGTAGSFTITASGRPTPALSITAGALPPSLTFHDNGDGTASILGTPTMADSGEFPVTVIAHNAVSEATQVLVVSVSAGTAIPALGGIGLAAMISLLAAIGAVLLRRTAG
jgi:hypothetical protein